jgi:hypothetical protein
MTSLVPLLLIDFTGSWREGATVSYHVLLPESTVAMGRIFPMANLPGEYPVDLLLAIDGRPRKDFKEMMT